MPVLLGSVPVPEDLATHSPAAARLPFIVAVPPMKLALVGLAGLAGFAGLWLWSARSAEDAIRAAVIVLGAAAVALLMPRRPVAAVGTVFMLAVFAYLALDLPTGTLRAEQPALVTLIATTIWYRADLRLPSLRPLLPLIAAAATYLIVLAISSAFVSEQPSLSLRMVGWSTLSMLGGLAAALLVAGRMRALLRWLSGTAAIVAVLGIIGAIGYTLFYLGAPWVSGTDWVNVKVNAFSHEPNLYASLLGAAIPIAAEAWRARPRAMNGQVLAVLLLAIGLGVTRGAYVGLAAGLVVYFLLVFRRSRLPGRARSLAVRIAVFGFVGFMLPLVLLNPFRSGVLVGGPFLEGPARIPSGEPALPFQLGTLGYRLEMVRRGLVDMAESPIIGRGAFSFGNRHLEPDGVPAVIAVLPFAVAHDAGLIGLVALSVFFALVFVRLWRAGRDKLLAGPAAALTASLTVLLVAFLATTALHFATTWLIVGAALGATLLRPVRREEPHLSGTG